MQFSSFSKTESGLTITLSNATPVTNVGSITFYSDNASGSFSKKEFRWSFNNIYWSSWETLTSTNITRINTGSNYYLFLQIRYVQTASGSGTVSTFSINYTLADTSIPTDSQSLTADPCTLYTFDVISRYVTRVVDDASLLNGYAGSYYLSRSHHTGLQGIDTIIGLQTALNSYAASSTLAQYIKSASIGSGLYWVNGMLDVSVAGGSGDVTRAYVDASFANFIKSASIGSGLYWVNGLLDVSVASGTGDVTKAYVDGSLALRDASISNLYSKHYTQETSLGNISQLTYALNASSGLYATNASVNLALVSNASLAYSSLLATALNSSSGLYATNSSVNNVLNSRVRETSLGPDFEFVGEFLYIVDNDLIISSSTGSIYVTSDASYLYIDVSKYVSLDYVDASLNNIRAVPISDACLGPGVSWTSGKLYVDVSTIAGDVTLAYVDGSLLERDVSIALKASNASVGLAFLTNTSLGNVSQLTYALNSSIGTYATNSSVNLAFRTNSSLGNVSQLTYATNSSIGAFATNASVNTALRTNASLGNVSQLTYATNSSIGAFATNASVNTAIANFATNTSVNSALYSNVSLGYASSLVTSLNTSIGNYALTSQLTITDTSLYITNATYIPEASLSDTYFVWDSGYLEVSAGSGDVTKAYVDGSLLLVYSQIAITDTSLYSLYATNASVNNAIASNSSLGYASALSTALNSSIGLYATNVSVNAAITSFATNASVNLAISNAFLTNTSLGNVSQLTYALNSSIGNYATNASVNDAFLTNVSLGYTSQMVIILNASYVSYDLTAYATNSSVNLAFYSNASLGLAFNQYTNVSLGYTSQLVTALNSSIDLYAANSSVNSAIANFSTNASVNTAISNAFLTNPSLGNVSRLTYAHNASINAINASLNDTFLLSAYVNTSEYYDGSINDIRLQFYSNASLGLANNSYATNASVNSALLTNVSLGTVSRLTFAHNTSIGALNASLNDVLDAYGIFIPEVSVSHTYFKWTSEYLEPSGFTGTFLADGSLVTVTNGLIMSVDAV